MSYDSPAAIVFDVNGNPIGTVLDGAFYRLQVEAKIDGYVQTNPNVIATGTVTANAGYGNFTVTQSMASNLNANVSGTVTANVGTTNGLALNSTLTDGTAKFKQYDGTNVIGTAAYPTRTDPTGTTAQPITDNGGSITIDGSITANIGTTNGLALDASVAKLTVSQGAALGTNTQAMIGGSVTASAPTYASGQINPLSLTTAGALRVDGHGTTQAIALADSPQLDAFGRLRISNVITTFDSKMLTDNSSLFWDDQQTSGSGTSSTYSSANAYVSMGVSLNTAGTRVRQTFRRFNYQPGKSQLVILTSVLGAPVSGVTRRVGLFDANNGLYFELSETLGVALRTSTSGSPVDTKINQEDWNLDKLDGYGLSGYSIDVTKDNIFVIDFQWLGAGRVRFGFDLGGSIIYCHQINNANMNTTSYMANPNLPIRFEISNNGTGLASSLIHICSTIGIEGGIDSTGLILSIDRGITPITTLNDSDLYPVVAIRLKSTATSAAIIPQLTQVMCGSIAAYRWTLIMNPTITGTALTFTGLTNSAVEYCVNTTSATKVTSGSGTRMLSGYGESTTQANTSFGVTLPSNLQLGASIAGVSDILVLCAQRITGTTESFYGSISWREQI